MCNKAKQYEPQHTKMWALTPETDWPAGFPTKQILDSISQDIEIIYKSLFCVVPSIVITDCY